MKITDIELLAALENLRIIHESDKSASPDWCFRIASAVVASAFGYNNRSDWTSEVKKTGLVEYGDLWDNAKTAKENYKRLCLKMEG